MKTAQLKQKTEIGKRETASLLETNEKLSLCSKEYEVTRSFQGKLSVSEMAHRMARIFLESETEITERNQKR